MKAAPESKGERTGVELRQWSTPARPALVHVANFQNTAEKLMTKSKRQPGK